MIISNYIDSNPSKIDSEAIKPDSKFKLDEINFDDFFEEPEKSIPIKSFGLIRSTIKCEDKQISLFDDFSSGKQRPNNETNIKQTKVVLFSSIKPMSKMYKILCNYIPQSSVDAFTKWNKNVRKRPNTDVDKLLDRENSEPLIKKLTPKTFCKGFDIIPKYLHARSSRKKKNNTDISDTRSSAFSCKAVSKAYKVFPRDKRPIINVTVVGPHKSGKSTLIGCILSTFDVFTTTFVKKTAWDATKAGSTSRQKAWLVDTSLYERSANETVVTSSYIFESGNKILRFSDTPGNDAYFIEQTLRTLVTSDIVMITTDCQSINHEYLRKICILIKVFSIDKVIIILTNIFGHNNDDENRIKILKIFKHYGCKFIPHFTTINKIDDVKLSEISSIMAIINTFEVEVDETRMLSPLMLEVLSIYKPIESVSPVIVGEVITGGISAGVNNTQSKAVIIPENITCTVKAMKIEDKDGTMKTKSFAFPGNIVELSLSEITSVKDMDLVVKRGDVLCHPQAPLTVLSEFTIKLMMIPRENNYIPIITGSSVFLWSRTKSCFAVISDIVSLDYSNSLSKKSSPRLIVEGAKTATVTIITEQSIILQLNSEHKLDILLLFHHSQLFAAGKFIMKN